MKTKTIYELNFKTCNGWHNLLYSSEKKAKKDLQNDFKEGNNTPFGIITCAYIDERILF